MFEKIGRAIKSAYNKHGAAGLACAAVVFGAIEGVTAFRAGKKVGENPDMSTKDKVLVTLPAVGSFALSAGCAFGSQSKNAASIGALMSQNLLNEKKQKVIMGKVEEFVGEENINKFKASFHPEPEVPKTLEVGQFLFIDDQTGAKKWATLEEMQEARYQFLQCYYDWGIATHGDWLETAGFQRYGKGELPLTVDEMGAPLNDLGDKDVGYSVTKQLEFGYESGVLDIRFIPIISSCDSRDDYYLVEFSTPFAADFEEY